MKSINGAVSRRSVLKALGAAGIAMAGEQAATSQIDVASVQTPSSQPGRNARNANPSLHRIRAGRMIVDLDADLGTIHSITVDGDPLGTNFVGNQQNTRGVELGDPHWTGDLVTTIWGNQPQQGRGGSDRSRWQRETTLDSDDTRKVALSPNGAQVHYDAPSRHANGIRDFTLSMNFKADAEQSFLWEFEIVNTSGQLLEIGELAVPLRANDDYGSVYRQNLPNVATLGRTTAIQKEIHEQKILAHAFVAGHSSYALLQRPSGEGPYLMVRCENDTSFECIYKVQGSSSNNWIGTDLFAVHSWATHRLRGWRWNPWVNGHTSLVLKPGEKRTFRLRFSLIDDYPAIRAALVDSGNLGVRCIPGMVVPEQTDVHVEVGSAKDLDEIQIHADGIEIKDRRRANNATLLTLSFAGRGAKTLKLLYNGGRWTNLHFFCVEDPEKLLKSRADFMARRQYYENPADPFHRNHLFLPFDYRQAKMVDDLDDVFEVGGTGDPGFGETIFLSEKNVAYPSREQIDKLEAYIDDCLFKYIQDPKTYEIRQSLYYRQSYPSSDTYNQHWAEQTTRTYNYCFTANIYHAMYRIAKRYGATRRRNSNDYLRMVFETCRKWFVTGTFKYAGLITGSNAVEILADIEREGWISEHAELLSLMKSCNDEYLRDPYPYSSEIEIDETGQHQVYFFTRLFAALGDAKSSQKNASVVRVLKAMRGGDQPSWFGYGNDLFAHPDLRGQICCWHSEALNGMALLRHFDDSEDPIALMKGYPGVLSVLHNILPDGMGFGWFNLTPGIFDWDPPRTFEGGSGLWGYLRAAKAYVVHDSAFGLIGYGCRVESTGGEVRVHPHDGVKKRVRWVSEKVDVEAHTGEILQASWNGAASCLRLQMGDSTGFVKTVKVIVRGLPPGEYEIDHGDIKRRIAVPDVLEFEWPIKQARDIQIFKLERMAT